MLSSPDLELTREALATSTLSHGLKDVGDRWTVQILLASFLGVRRFDEIQNYAQIPRPTLSNRLRSLVQMGVLKPKIYQENPPRYEYHLTRKGIGLYDATLMIWAWEKRWGDRAIALPQKLIHTRCNHSFSPLLTCRACGEAVSMKDLSFQLIPNKRLNTATIERLQTPRMTGDENSVMGLGLRVDRWSLMIVAAVVLGCHYFDQISKVLQIGPSVLSRRLSGMLSSNLLHCEADTSDARRRVYRLTPSSRDLFGYIVCLSTWAGEDHLHEMSSIRPRHTTCQRSFYPKVACSHCRQDIDAWAVDFEFKGKKPT